MNIDPVVHEIGSALVEHAQNEENFTAQRGLVDELFPYIYQASRRMSTRAISRFLKDKFKIKLSAVTIAKALREPDDYWLEWYESVEPAARVFADAHDLDVDELLGIEDGFFSHLKTKEPVLAVGKNNAAEKLAEYHDAVGVLESCWFAFDQDCRRTCVNSIPAETEDEAPKKKRSARPRA